MIIQHLLDLELKFSPLLHFDGRITASYLSILVYTTYIIGLSEGYVSMSSPLPSWKGNTTIFLYVATLAFVVWRNYNMYTMTVPFLFGFTLKNDDFFSNNGSRGVRWLFSFCTSWQKCPKIYNAAKFCHLASRSFLELNFHSHKSGLFFVFFSVHFFAKVGHNRILPINLGSKILQPPIQSITSIMKSRLSTLHKPSVTNH